MAALSFIRAAVFCCDARPRSSRYAQCSFFIKQQQIESHVYLLKCLIAISITIILLPARAELLAEAWIERFPEPKSYKILPGRIITVAKDYLQCSPHDQTNPVLNEQVSILSRAHYLDDFTDIAEKLSELSDSGEPTASLLLSIMLEEGNLGEVDSERAARIRNSLKDSDSGFIQSWITRFAWELASNKEQEAVAAESFAELKKLLQREPENTYIARRAAWFLAFIDGAPIDESEALRLFESSIKSCPENALAKMHFGRFLINSFKDEVDLVQRGIGLMNSATKTGISEALYWQAMQHANAPDDFAALAVALYEKAARKGDADAAYEVALMHESGQDTPVNIRQAGYFFKLASHLGEQDALIAYARYLRDGISSPADPEGSIKYFEAALLADDENWIELPQTYELIGDRRSLYKAKEIYEGALEKPNPDGASLGVMARSQSKAGLARIEQKIAALANSAPSNRLPTEVVKAALPEINFGNFHALLIGNEKYENFSDLKSAARDADDLARILDELYGFKTRTLVNASRSEIIDALNEYRYSLLEEDNFFLFYAGHGTYDEETEEGFWQPVDAGETDANWISNDRITRTLRGFKSRNVMVVADSCYSGVVFREEAAKRTQSYDSNAEYFRQLLEKKTRVALTSGGLEPVMDTLPGTRNSIFSGALISMLRNSNGITTAQQLFMEISEDVVSTASSMGLEQTPEYAGLRRSGHDGGDFLFVPLRLDQKSPDR